MDGSNRFSSGKRTKIDPKVYRYDHVFPPDQETEEVLLIFCFFLFVSILINLLSLSVFFPHLFDFHDFFVIDYFQSYSFLKLFI